MKDNNGSALILAMVFVCIVAFSNIALLKNVEYAAIKLNESSVYSCAYYASIAALRYAALAAYEVIPEEEDMFTPTEFILTGEELGGNFYSDIGYSSDDLEIKIYKIEEGENTGKYAISAKCNY